jgi:hypothetical protein
MSNDHATTEETLESSSKDVWIIRFSIVLRILVVILGIIVAIKEMIK